MSLKVALIFGGVSPEHEVSIVSARSVHRNLLDASFQVEGFGIDQQGGWHSGKNVFDELVALVGKDYKLDQKKRVATLASLLNGDFDVVFPLIHGVTGEDGGIQGFCELLGLPFVGGDSLCQSLCYDKLATRQILSHHGLPQPVFLPFFVEQFVGGRYWVIDQIEETFTYPVFVKPSRTGSSIGVSKVASRSQLEAALSTAFEYDDRIIVEENIVGREIEVALLGAVNPIISAPGEIIPENDFYDFEEKYVKNTTSFEIPAMLSSEQIGQISDYAKRTWRIMNCYGLARVDFLVGNDQIFLNEVNTVPGFTDISMYPRLLRESGVNSNEMMQQLVELALNRERNQRRRDFRSNSNWFET